MSDPTQRKPRRDKGVAKMPDSERKGSLFVVRIAPDEAAILDALAGAWGLHTRASTIRRAVAECLARVHQAESAAPAKSPRRS